MFRLKIITVVLVFAFSATAYAGPPASQQPLPLKNPNSFSEQRQLEFNPGTPLALEENGDVLVDGQNVPLRTATEQNLGFFLPDGEGGMIWSKSNREQPAPNPDYMDARELKLQVRELAAQLLDNIQQHELRGKIGMPTSFVNQDNFDQSSSFGRYIAEQMFHEFNQRGFSVREYRIGDPVIRMREGEGDFYLTREKGSVPVNDKTNVVLVGTYYQDGKNLFINARLIRPSDGLVYRTGQMVVQITPTTKTMLAKTGRRLQAGTLGIESRAAAQENKARRSGSIGGAGAKGGPAAGNANLDVLDQGYDIH